MTIRPSVSSPQVFGELCGRPSRRVVIRIAWWRGRRNSSSRSRSARVFVAMLRALSALPGRGGLDLDRAGVAAGLLGGDRGADDAGVVEQLGRDHRRADVD